MNFDDWHYVLRNEDLGLPDGRATASNRDTWASVLERLEQAGWPRAVNPDGPWPATVDELFADSTLMPVISVWRSRIVVVNVFVYQRGVGLRFRTRRDH